MGKVYLEQGKDYDGQMLGTHIADNGDEYVMPILVDALGNLSTSASSSSYQAFKDYGGRQALHSGFGGVVAQKIIPQIQANFTYRYDTRTVKNLSANGGAITFTNNLLTVGTGTAINGVGDFETVKTVVYSPAQDALAYFTLMVTAPKPLSRQFMGLCNGQNGFRIGFEEENLVIARKANNVRMPDVLYSEFNGCTIVKNSNTNYTITWDDGFSYTYIPTFINIHKIQYGFLGILPIAFELYCGHNGGWRVLHTVDLVGIQAETSIANPYLPISALVENFGNNTEMKLYSGSIMAGTIGGNDGTSPNPNSREFTVESGVVAVSAPNNLPIIIFHNKPTMYGVPNKISNLLFSMAGATDCNKSVVFRMIRLSAVPTGTSFVDIDSANANLEYSLTGSISLTGSEVLYSRPLSKVDSFDKDVNNLNLLLPPDGYAALTVTSVGLGDVFASIRESERY